MRSIVFLLITLVSIARSNTLDLSGNWKIKLDKDDKGLEQKWFAGDWKEADTLHLPGSLQEQGFGDKPSSSTEWTTRIGKELLSDARFQDYTTADDFKSPFWLTPKRHYVGPAWYQRNIFIPENESWHSLFLERPHWKTTVWIDETEIASCDSLGTPHIYDLTKITMTGQHRLTIRVDNRVIIPVGDDAHSISDQTQTNWNGIIGKIALIGGNEDNWIFDDVQIYPDIKTKTIKVCVDFKNPFGSLYGKLYVQAKSADGTTLSQKTFSVKLKDNKTRVEFKYDMGKNVRLWDEFSPNLYTLKLHFKENIRKGVPFNNTYQTTFGMRQLGTSGTQFTINGRNIFLRGTLECCIFPLTGYPPTDIESWKKILRVCKAHGLNHIRFHSWCPPEAAFVAADEMGFYYQVEASCWATFGSGTAVDTWIYQECDRMLKTYGNHPSFILMAPGNEPHGGKNRDPFLAKLVNYLAAKDPRRLYTAGAGWPRLQENQFHITSAVRLQNYRHLRLTDTPQTAADYREFVAQYTVPIISHEIGQWCVYPNPAEWLKYTGSLAGGNIEIARDILKKSGMEALGQDFVMASGKFQAILYKQEIESALRTPGFGGFQLLDLHDFPGQGMAPVGVLDCFWDSKGYITAEQYSRFCGPTVPLARMEKLVFTNNEIFKAVIDLAHYGPKDFTAKPTCYLRNSEGHVLKLFTLAPKIIPTGGLTTLGTITLPLSEFQQAQKLDLEVAIDNLNIANDWNFWVYPASLPAENTRSVHITKTLNDKTTQILNSGGSVLLMPQPYDLKAETFGTFKPIFWNLTTFPNRKEHTLGIFCDPKHPALTNFPTDFHSNWQWQDLLSHSKPIILDDIDSTIEPIVRTMDDWNRCRKLALIFEVTVGSGKLLICSIDLNSALEDRPVARQMRYSLLNYMQSDTFNPQKAVSIDAVRNLFKPASAAQQLNARIISVDSEESGNEAAKAIDNDPMTFWHTAWINTQPSYPHELVIELERSVTLKGITCLPRQDGESGGWVADYEIYIADKNGNWNAPTAKGKFDKSDMPQKVIFDKPAAGRFIRFVGISGFGTDPFCSMAELELQTEN